MKTLLYSVATWLLFVVLASCTSTPRPVSFPKPVDTALPAQATLPIPVTIPDDLAFSTSLIQTLSQSGLSILSVEGSVKMALFQSTDKAVWIETDEGIVEAIFFADSAEVSQIHITEQVNKTEMRYLYIIQAPLPTLVHDQTIDAAFPLYFTTKDNMLMITSSAELDKALKQIFP